MAIVVEASGDSPRVVLLKCWPEFFEALVDGSKPFEVRREDEGLRFQVGDVVCLREYHPSRGDYTGRETSARVTYVLRGGGSLGLIPEGVVVLGLDAT